MRGKSQEIAVLMLSRTPDWDGGVVEFVRMLCANFSKAIQVHRFYIGHRKNTFAAVLRPFYPLYDAVRLVSAAKKLKIDIVHINPSLTLQSLLRDGLFIWVIRLFAPAKIYVSFHGWEEKVEQKIETGRFLKMIFASTFNGVAHISVLASSFAESLYRLGIDKTDITTISTMFDGVNIGDQGLVEKSRVEEILFLSRLIKEKGILELLDGFFILASDYPGLSLTVAGDGPLRKKILEKVVDHHMEKRVRLTGYISGSEKVALFRAADIFVLPSYYGEGCPIALLEALAVGLPVVTTRNRGIVDVISDPEHGILIDAVTPTAIGEAIKTYITEPKYTDMVRKNNYRLAWSRYEAAHVTNIVEQIYREIDLHVQ